MVIECERWAEKPQFGFNDTIISQVSAARQGFKQLDIRLTMAVSAVSVCFPAVCNPWLSLWPLSKLAHLSASPLVLQGEACSFSALCRRPPLHKLLRLLFFPGLPWRLSTAVAQRKAVIKLHDAKSGASFIESSA